MKKGILIFLIGFLCGALFLNLLCINAIKVHKNIIRAELGVEQQLLAQRAEKKRDYIRALVHRWNVVDTASQDGFRVFRPETSQRIDGGFFFPFHAIVLRQVEKTTDPKGKGQKINEGLQRAQLALTMEKAGMIEAAEEQWEKATELIPIDIDRLKIMSLENRKNIHSDLYKEAEKNNTRQLVDLKK